MKRLLLIVFAGLIAVSANAQDGEDTVTDDLFVVADMPNLDAYHWKRRPVVVFADSENDPAFIEQMELLTARPDALRERDVIVLVDTNPEARLPVRLKLRPRGFMLALVGKDGQLKIRKPFPQDVREITASIDKMPMRQREIREDKERPRP